MSLIDQAIEFAAHKHRHQQRKGTFIEILIVIKLFLTPF